MTRICPTPDGTTLQVVRPGADPLPIHPFWLRERCTDASSLDAQTEQRLYNPSELDPDAHILRIEEAFPEEFEVTFSDGHRGTFTGRAILAELPGQPPDIPPPAAWSAASPPPPSVDWRSCQTDAGRLAALSDFLVHGYIIAENLPRRPRAVLQVARRFGFPRETNFGVLFDVRSVPAANDLAYTSLPLDPHTDNPYRAPVPGIQLLHCIANRSVGGFSTLVDGLAIAHALRRESPEAFDILTSTPVRFRYIDAEAELISCAPLIELDGGAEFAAIHYSPRLDFVPLLPPHTLDKFYAARRLLDAMLKSAVFERRFKLEDGHLMMFDNRRLLHGRTGFDPSTGLRHLQGCYIDADGPRSLYRTLRRKIA